MGKTSPESSKPPPSSPPLKPPPPPKLRLNKKSNSKRKNTFCFLLFIPSKNLFSNISINKTNTYISTNIVLYTSYPYFQSCMIFSHVWKSSFKEKTKQNVSKKL